MERSTPNPTPFTPELRRATESAAEFEEQMLARALVIDGQVPMAESMNHFTQALRGFSVALQATAESQIGSYPHRNTHSRLTPSQKAAQRAKNKAARAARKRNR